MKNERPDQSPPSAEAERPLCRRCGLPFLEDRVCSGSHFTLLCAEAERPAGEMPPAHIIDLAVQVSGWSPCRSKRGVVIFTGEHAVAHGYNYKPRGFDCDQTVACKATCRREAIHAEQQALLSAGPAAAGSDMLHVKTVDGRLVPSGGPSCVQCSKLAVAARIRGVWLYHDAGWQRYPIAEFHRQSLAAQPSAEAERLCERCRGARVDTYVDPDAPNGFTERPCPACAPEAERPAGETELHVRIVRLGDPWFAQGGGTWASAATPEQAVRELLRTLNTDGGRWPIAKGARDGE